ncbi:MAG: 23S rRNA (uracil(1939)-C(5))-methyltransferase RlmD, partial [Eubacteriaceae bacterium]|nr:23S rRNA (uracil(1939)-C(5))-methyltransferase RlmD [Eubacteriaceae bacterium]
RAEVYINKVRSGRAEATIRRIIEKVPYETEGICKHFGRCGGCATGGITYEKQLELKENYVKGLFKKANLDMGEYEGIIPAPFIFNYRNKMEFSFGNERIGEPLCLGMHERGRHHNVISIDGCAISPGDFNIINAACEKYFKDISESFYNKNTREGFLRHLVLRHSVRGKELLINLVTTSRGKLDGEAFVSLMLSLKLENSISGILHTTTDSFADAVKADKTEVLYGKDSITETICGLSFEITPFSFFQTNTLAAEGLYEKVREYAGTTKDKTVFDLYCGTGTIAQIVSAGAKKVYGIELVGEAVEAATANAIKNGIDNCVFIAGDVMTEVDKLESADVIILDPPRAGIMPKAAQKIISFMPQAFVYVSCKPSSLVADLPAFIEAGYGVERSCCVDMFANTEHVECVVLMSRVKE